MLVKTKGCAIQGIDAISIIVEVNVSMGQGYCIVGLPDLAVKESLHRTESAIKSNGFHMPRTKLLVNLSPADLKKTGPAFDLPIAIGILAASEQLKASIPIDQYLMMGELGLDGTLRPLKGVLAMAIQAKEAGYLGLIIPKSNIKEAALIQGLLFYGFENLMEVVQFCRNRKKYLPKSPLLIKSSVTPVAPKKVLYFEEIKGQVFAKRAIEIASAGGHNLIMIGPPGAGKTMLAKAMISILPPMNGREALETSKIYSVIGKLHTEDNLLQERPFRNPHHSLSAIALVGGGSIPQPGEISLAHNGVLFLDELPEFKRSAIEVLRQPMEEGFVTISRAKMSLDFPARFMLLASMNPCPCGYYNHPTRNCSCSKASIQKYLSKISGPILDRIDLQIEVAPVSYEILRSVQKNDTTAEIAKRVMAARIIQTERYDAHSGINNNAQMNHQEMKKWCTLDQETEHMLQNAMVKFELSARAFTRIIKVARTIADLAHEKKISLVHISEAIQFRCLDKGNWGDFSSK